MAESLLEKAQRLGMKPAGSPGQSESLLQKAQRLGMEPAGKEKKPGVFQSLVQGVAQPFLKVAASGKQLTKVGNQEEYNKIRDEGVDFGYFGKATPVGSVKGGINSVGDFGRGVASAVGTGAEIASYAVGGATAPGVVKTGLKEGLKQAAKVGAKEGVTVGAIGGFGSGLQKEDATFGTVLGDTLTGAATGGVLGAGLGAAGAGVKKLRLPKNPSIASGDVDRLVGTIAQGGKDDIAQAKRALSNIDINGVRTYDDLANALDSKVAAVSERLDDVLDLNPNTFKLKDFTKKTKAGTKSISSNPVDDAIVQLEQYYKKTNDIAGQAKMIQLRIKARNKGLSIKEVNNLARLHGRDLNAFNANGELASGLTKKAAENTRKGIKDTAKELFKDDVYDAADEELSALINTRKLAQDVAEAVNKLKQKVSQRTLGEKVGRLIFQASDLLSGGILRGTVQAAFPRGQGIKLMNALDLEKNLAKNLKTLKEVLGDNISEEAIIQKLERMVKGELPTLQIGEKVKKRKLASKPKPVRENTIAY